MEGDQRKPAVMGVSGGHQRNKKSMGNGNDFYQNKANEDLINFLEHKLEEIEKKLQRT